MGKMSTGAANAFEYLALLRGWRRKLVTALRRTVLPSTKFEETIEYGHLVYSSNGPRLGTGGKYELATLEVLEDTPVSPTIVRRLAKEGAALNRKLGDPTRVAKKPK